MTNDSRDAARVTCVHSSGRALQPTAHVQMKGFLQAREGMLRAPAASQPQAEQARHDGQNSQRCQARLMATGLAVPARREASHSVASRIFSVVGRGVAAHANPDVERLVFWKSAWLER